MLTAEQAYKISQDAKPMAILLVTLDGIRMQAQLGRSYLCFPIFAQETVDQLSSLGYEVKLIHCEGYSIHEVSWHNTERHYAH